MLKRRFVCSLDELPPGAMKLVDVGKFGVGVYNVQGSLHAIVNYCSHEGAPLCLGYIGGTNEVDPERAGRAAAHPRRADRSVPLAQLGIRHHHGMQYR